MFLMISTADISTKCLNLQFVKLTKSEIIQIFFIYFFKKLEGTKKPARVVQSGVKMIWSKTIEKVTIYVVLLIDQV